VIYQGTPILFSPPTVASVLVNLPTIATLIPSPAVEGAESEAFPGVLRTTQRELYRWIANPHYEHLAEPMMLLEEVHAAGCIFEQMLRTSSRELFVSLSAEVFLAHDLLRRGFEVETIQRSADRSHDLRVRGDGIEMAVEVYSPRELRAVDEWTHEVLDLAQYLDVRSSYRSEVRTTIEQPIPPEPWQLDPYAHDRMLEATRGAVIAEISHDAEEALSELRPLDKSYPHEGTPMTTTITLSDVQPAADEGPVRSGTFSYPGFSGYSPAGVFAKIVERTIRKAQERQTHSVEAETRGLVVYLMGTQIADDLTHEAHLRPAEALLAEVDPSDLGLDVIAFVVRALPRGLAYVLAIWDDAHLTRAKVDALFGQMA
jgi:hypothetical protein